MIHHIVYNKAIILHSITYNIMYYDVMLHYIIAWGGRGDRVYDLALALGVIQRLLEVQLFLVWFLCC